MNSTLDRVPLGVPNIALLASEAGARLGDRAAIRYKTDGGWRERSYAELATEVRELSRGLLALGVQPGEHVALCAETRPEWTVCDLAIAEVGAVCVPVYPTNSVAECEWVLSDSEARVVICGNAEQVAKVEQIRERLPVLRHLVSIDPVAPESKATVLADIVALGASISSDDVGRRAAAVRPEDVATIVYTSGTTGNPKGCVLTHGNWRAAMDAAQVNLSPEPGDVTYLYLPLAHLLARATSLITYENGACLAFWGGDIRQIVAELPEVKPTHLPSVPRLFERIYATVSGFIDSGMAPSELHGLVRDAFGGRIRQAATGGAPIAPEILRFFSECGIPIFEGYGMTESTALISANSRKATKIGTVGRAYQGVEIRIAPDGEVLARGANVFPRYHRNPRATEETLKDGWLHTGDLGSLDEDGYLTITGRKKDLIITSAGKNLAPSNLENDLRRCRWIAAAVMLGDRRPYPVALIALDPDEILPWASECGLPEDLAALAASDEVRELIQGVLDEANAGYAPAERIRRFAVLDHAMTVEDGELTPSLKVRRAAVAERYAELVDALYG
jgi:long-chain acyl-CoA synthetase